MRSDQLGGSSWSAINSRRSRGANAPGAERWQDWQDHARNYAHHLGLARFPAAITSSICSRCVLRVEQRNEAGEWDPTTDPRLGPSLFDAYRNEMPGQNAAELVGLQAWHYSVAGEMYQAMFDLPDVRGTQWGIFSARSIDWDSPEKGWATIKMTPSGTVADGTAIAVPRDRVVRFWQPDEEWSLYATSQMASVIEDLHRLWTLNRYVRGATTSRLVMGGMVWTPGTAHEHDAQGQGAPGAGSGEAGHGGPQGASKLDRQFVEWARRRFNLADDDQDPALFAPFGIHYGNDQSAPPKFVELGSPLDPNGVAHRDEARRDFARGVDVPGGMVEAGGPGDASHWSEWLVDRKFWDSAGAPRMDRIAHLDLTRTLLLPVLNFYRLPPELFRVGYDPNPVIVEADKSDLALRLNMGGLLRNETTLEECGFDPTADAMPADQFERLIALRSSGRAGDATPGDGTDAGAGMGMGDVTDRQLPVNGSNTVEAPPEQPAALRAASAPVQEVQGPVAVQAVARTGRQATQRLLTRLTTVRRDAGRSLLAMAEHALAEALRKARAKVVTRASSRKATTAELRAELRAAAEAGQPLGPRLAAVGITEAEALDHTLDTFAAQAARLLERHDAETERALRAAGLDPQLARTDPALRAQAVAYLAAALLAIAHQRLAAGDARPGGPGEVSGAVPARIVANALAVGRGAAVAQLASTADSMPTAQRVAGPSLEVVVADALADPEARAAGEEQPIEWTWEWGFFSDPVSPFEPHQDLGFSAFTTTLPGPPYTDEVDEALVGDSPFGEYYFPQDHDGCSCTWVPVNDRAESGPGERSMLIPS